jgi:hypothetical protein
VAAAVKAGGAASAASAFAVAALCLATIALFVLMIRWPMLAAGHRMAALGVAVALAVAGGWAYRRFATDARYVLPVLASLPLVGAFDGWWIRVALAECGCHPQVVLDAANLVPVALLVHGFWRQRRDRRRREATADH